MVSTKDNNSENHNHNNNMNLIWLLTSLAIIVILQVVLPFPLSFIVSIIVIMGIGIYRFDRALKKMGMAGIKDWHKSMSSGLDPRRGTGAFGLAHQPLRFSCLNCGNEHDKIACPNCGSKGVRPL